MIGEGFKRDAEAVLPAAEQHRKAPHLVARRNNGTVVPEDQNRRGALDDALCEPNALGKILPLVDERRGKLRRVDRSAGHRVEMSAAAGKEFFRQRLGVVYDADDTDRVCTQLGTDEKRLRVAVADTSDGRGPLHFFKNMLEFRPEGRISYIMDDPLQTDFPIICGKSPAARAEMRMIIRPEKNIGEALPP